VFAPILGACLGAATYRGLIARNLPTTTIANPETNDNCQGDTQAN